MQTQSMSSSPSYFPPERFQKDQSRIQCSVDPINCVYHLPNSIGFDSTFDLEYLRKKLNVIGIEKKKYCKI